MVYRVYTSQVMQGRLGRYKYGRFPDLHEGGSILTILYASNLNFDHGSQSVYLAFTHQPSLDLGIFVCPANTARSQLFMPPNSPIGSHM